MKSTRTTKAINLLQIADLTNPNKEAMKAAESKLIEMKVVDASGSLINSTQNRSIMRWLSKNF